MKEFHWHNEATGIQTQHTLKLSLHTMAEIEAKAKEWDMGIDEFILHCVKSSPVFILQPEPMELNFDVGPLPPSAKRWGTKVTRRTNQDG